MRRLAVLVLAFVLALVAAPAFSHPGDSAVDQDHDGVRDSEDNCQPPVSNSNQADTDFDGQGDACDLDDDGDGVEDGSDNCSLVYNPDRSDTDGDGAGDPCDADDDGDGVADSRDNCAVVPNAGQEDGDGDGVGDACTGQAGAGPRPEGPGTGGGGGGGGSGSGTTPGGSTGPGATPGTLREPLDATMSVRGDDSLADFASDGLTVEFTCSRACSVGISLLVDRRAARRLGLRGSAPLAEAGWRLGSKGRTYLFLVPAAKQVKRLRRFASLRGRLEVAVSDADGRSSRVTQPLLLER